MTVLDSILDHVDPIPSDRSWSEIASDDTVCMDCGTVSEITEVETLTRRVTCPNEACDTGSGCVFNPGALLGLMAFMALVGYAAVHLAGFPETWPFAAGLGMLVVLYSGTAGVAHRGGL